MCVCVYECVYMCVPVSYTHLDVYKRQTCKTLHGEESYCDASEIIIVICSPTSCKHSRFHADTRAGRSLAQTTCT